MIYGQLNHAAPENGAAVKSPLGQPLPLPCLPPLLPLTNRRHVPCAGSHHGITAQRDRSIVAGGEPAVAYRSWWPQGVFPRQGPSGPIPGFVMGTLAALPPRCTSEVPRRIWSRPGNCMFGFVAAAPQVTSL